MPFTRLTSILETIDDTKFYPELRLLTWHPRGVLDDVLADEIIGVVELNELSDEEPFHRYTDFSRLEYIHLRIGHVFKIAEQRRVTPQNVKSAFYAETVVGVGIARLYESLMKEAQIEVRAFTDRNAAAEWLEVPVSRLLPV